MTGEGIAQALETGRLAAEAILRTGPVHAGAARLRYERAVRSALLADHRMALLLGEVLRHPLGAGGAMRVAALTPWTRRNVARWLFEDEPRAVACTPRRWHRRFLGRPGAWSSPS
jgi:flavin-dependent dehydrogenase